MVPDMQVTVPPPTQIAPPGEMSTREHPRGYISATSKHNADILASLRDAIRGHPRMPPIPVDLI
jgi:hypothetical protein